MTNSIPYLDDAIRWSESLSNAPAAVLVFIMCIASGYVWRAIRVFPNRFTPLVVMLAGAFLLMGLTWVSHSTAPVIMRNACVGFIIGFAAWVAHRLVIKRIEDRFGKITDDTEFVEKPKQEKEDKE